MHHAMSTTCITELRFYIPTRHKIGHLRDVLLSQSVGMVLIELNPNKAE